VQLIHNKSKVSGKLYGTKSTKKSKAYNKPRASQHVEMLCSLSTTCCPTNPQEMELVEFGPIYAGYWHSFFSDD